MENENTPIETTETTEPDGKVEGGLAEPEVSSEEVVETPAAE